MDALGAYDLNSRLYVELVPDDSSRATINGIAYHLKKQVSGTFIDPLKWHVTVIHFGKVLDVYHDLLAVQPALSKELFLQTLNIYADYSKTVLEDETMLKITGLSLFGDNRNVLVLSLETTPEIIAAHQQALDYLYIFFETCGIAEPIKFMQNNHNFQNALAIRPHLTLARHVKDPELDAFRIPSKELLFLPADIAGL